MATTRFTCASESQPSTFEALLVAPRARSGRSRTSRKMGVNSWMMLAWSMGIVYLNVTILARVARELERPGRGVGLGRLGLEREAKAAIVVGHHAVLAGALVGPPQARGPALPRALHERVEH